MKKLIFGCLLSIGCTSSQQPQPRVACYVVVTYHSKSLSKSQQTETRRVHYAMGTTHLVEYLKVLDATDLVDMHMNKENIHPHKCAREED